MHNTNHIDEKLLYFSHKLSISDAIHSLWLTILNYREFIRLPMLSDRCFLKDSPVYKHVLAIDFVVHRFVLVTLDYRIRCSFDNSGLSLFTSSIFSIIPKTPFSVNSPTVQHMNAINGFYNKRVSQVCLDTMNELHLRNQPLVLLAVSDFPSNVSGFVYNLFSTAEFSIAGPWFLPVAPSFIIYVEGAHFVVNSFSSLHPLVRLVLIAISTQTKDAKLVQCHVQLTGVSVGPGQQKSGSPLSSPFPWGRLHINRFG